MNHGRCVRKLLGLRLDRAREARAPQASIARLERKYLDREREGETDRASREREFIEWGLSLEA